MVSSRRYTVRIQSHSILEGQLKLLILIIVDCSPSSCVRESLHCETEWLSGRSVIGSGGRAVGTLPMDSHPTSASIRSTRHNRSVTSAQMRLALRIAALGMSQDSSNSYLARCSHSSLAEYSPGRKLSRYDHLQWDRPEKNHGRTET